jgi:hypothetical protein
MVAYSFKRQFVAPIKAGTKAQTIRADRKRHAREGEALQLYTGMRTRACQLIGRAVCAGVQPITIDARDRPVIVLPDRELRPLAGIDDFARLDGFEDWQAMRRFWEEYHPGSSTFSGVLITWRDFANAEPPDA